MWVWRQLFCFLLQRRLYIACILFTHIYIVAQQGYAMKQTGITVMLWSYHSVERRRERILGGWGELWVLQLMTVGRVFGGGGHVLRMNLWV